MSHLSSLPPELLTKILDLVAQSSGTARYARVDRFWQSFFEAKTFKSLILEQDDLDKQYVKHIWFRIHLNKVPRKRPATFTSKLRQLVLPCQQRIRRSIRLSPDRIFTESIYYLWRILSDWKTPSGENSQGLTLELSADEPDRQKKPTRRNVYSVNEDMKLYKEYLASGSTEGYEHSADVHTTYIDRYEILKLRGRSTESWSTAVPPKLFGSRHLSFGYWEYRDILHHENPELPNVPVVTEFLIRKRNFREIRATALDRMIQSLPRVESVNIERWRSPVLEREQQWCREAKAPFGMSLPLSVKTLSLYGETSYIFHSWPVREVNTMALAKCLRQYGKHLENLSVSHLIDAKDFFGTFWSTHSDDMTESFPEWSHIKTLSLTSEILTTNTEENINNILCAAARAARKMPKLQLLELWNGRKKQACVFRYRVAATVCEIAWLGTHVETLDKEVVKAWKETSMAHGRHDLRASTNRLDSAYITSTGSILRYLDLKSQIMHPVSGYRTMTPVYPGYRAVFE